MTADREQSFKTPDPTTFISEQGVESDGEAWAAVMVDAPPGWVFEVPGRRRETAGSIELTMFRKGRA